MNAPCFRISYIGKSMAVEAVALSPKAAAKRDPALFAELVKEILATVSTKEEMPEGCEQLAMF